VLGYTERPLITNQAYSVSLGSFIDIKQGFGVLFEDKWGQQYSKEVLRRLEFFLKIEKLQHPYLTIGLPVVVRTAFGLL